VSKRVLNKAKKMLKVTASPKGLMADNYKHATSKSGEFRVSQSKVKGWRKCHYYYYLRFVKGLTKKVKSRSLQVGTIVHSMLDADAEGDDPMELLKKTARENIQFLRQNFDEYGDIIDDVRQIMTEYFRYYNEKDFRLKRINGRSGEHPFEIELEPGVIWTGKIDKIGWTPNKLQWIGETKTFKRRPSDGSRWRSVQAATYIRLVRMMGWVSGELEGMVWDYINNKPPTKPGLLKNGKDISKKAITTLPITITETLQELGLNPKLYKDYIKRSEDKLDEWFYRIETPVDESVVSLLWDDFTSSIHQMMDGHGKYKDKCVDTHCDWCDMNAICQAELEGSDVDYVIEHDYVVGDPDQFEPVIAD